MRCYKTLKQSSYEACVLYNISCTVAQFVVVNLTPLELQLPNMRNYYIIAQAILPW